MPQFDYAFIPSIFQYLIQENLLVIKKYRHFADKSLLCFIFTKVANSLNYIRTKCLRKVVWSKWKEKFLFNCLAQHEKSQT